MLPLLILIILIIVFGVVVATTTRQRRATDYLVARRGTARALGRDNDLLIPSTDSAEVLRLDMGSDAIAEPVHNLLLIEYIDAKGNRSRRRITVINFKKYGDTDGTMRCYCHERKDYRSFYLSRMQSVVDMKTGEVAASPVVYFAEHFRPVEDNPLRKAFITLDAELLVLAFMARVDDRMTKHERVVIASYILSEAKADLNSEELDGRIKRMHCDAGEFKRAVKVIANYTQDRKTRVVDAARSLIAADGSVDDREGVAVAKLAVALGVSGQ